MNFIRAKAASIFRFYYEGFRNMPEWGIRVWIIILIKLFIMFVILRLFFFPDFLKSGFDNDEERGNYVLEQLVNKPSEYD
ncbi:MAG: DUF4492 domain-containing protein [Bacteroidales bacterium]|jgi:hypothetical protein|nr:DUF4492 domain-containing protein [Bacteroidales bacterium]